MKYIMMTSFLFSVFCCSVSLANPETNPFDDAITKFNRFAQFDLPKLTKSQVTKLGQRQVVTIIDRKPNKPDRALGMILVNTDPRPLWLAYRDLHFQQQKSTTEFLLELQKPDIETWYGYLELPWPIADRHWIVKTWNNHKLAKQTSNTHWEHPWKLVKTDTQTISQKLANQNIPDTIKPKEAIFTPVNEGAWAILSIGEKTLLVYHATTVIGGNVPDNLIAPFVLRTFDEMLMSIRDRAEKSIKKHYLAPHKKIIGGDGKPIDYF